MSSPLLPYANSFLLFGSEAAVDLVDGRWVTQGGIDQENWKYLVRCFLKRSENSGASTGSKPVPLASELGGQMMPGASGDSFIYRGYALEWVFASSSESPDNYNWQPVDGQYDWMAPGKVCDLSFGDDQVMKETRVQRSSGKFGGKGIDQIVYAELGGVPIVVSGAELEV